jgi:hypothetical protein
MIILKQVLNYSKRMILINLNLKFLKNYYNNLKLFYFIHLKIMLWHKKIKFYFAFFIIQLIIFLGLKPY